MNCSSHNASGDVNWSGGNKGRRKEERKRRKTGEKQKVGWRRSRVRERRDGRNRKRERGEEGKEDKERR